MRHRRPILLVLVVVLVAVKTVIVSAADSGSSHFRAGAARIDITPSLSDPVPMSGFGGRSDPFTKEHIGYEILVTPFQPGAERIAIDELLRLLNVGKRAD
jgi:hypothetical protein